MLWHYIQACEIKGYISIDITVNLWNSFEQTLKFAQCVQIFQIVESINKANAEGIQRTYYGVTKRMTIENGMPKL